MVQNLGTYFVPYVVTIEWMFCLHKKIERSSVSQRPRLSSTKIFPGLAKLASYSFPTTCHPMTGPDLACTYVVSLFCSIGNSVEKYEGKSWNF